MRAYKAENMPAFTLRQFRHESETWKRTLCFMSDENVHLKIRLSEILRDDRGNSVLEAAETFQTRFIREDNVIRILRDDVLAFDNLLVREVFEDGAILRKLMQKLKIIRFNINEAERQFNKLKVEFNNYFLDYSSTR